jgi:hypothetical protein
MSQTAAARQSTPQGHIHQFVLCGNVAHSRLGISRQLQSSVAKTERRNIPIFHAMSGSTGTEIINRCRGATEVALGSLFPNNRGTWYLFFGRTFDDKRLRVLPAADSFACCFTELSELLRWATVQGTETEGRQGGVLVDGSWCCRSFILFLFRLADTVLDDDTVPLKLPVFPVETKLSKPHPSDVAETRLGGCEYISTCACCRSRSWLHCPYCRNCQRNKTDCLQSLNDPDDCGTPAGMVCNTLRNGGMTRHNVVATATLLAIGKGRCHPP